MTHSIYEDIYIYINLKLLMSLRYLGIPKIKIPNSTVIIPNTLI